MKTKEVASKLQISEKTVRRLARQGFLPCQIVPGRKRLYLFDELVIDGFLRSSANKLKIDDKRYEVNL